MNKKVIGLTGVYCSGKSTVEKILKEHDFLIIDVDKIGHNALKEKKKEIIYNFGIKIIKDSEIDRKKLGEIVFNDKKKLLVLNSIVHPFMIEKVKELITVSKDSKICINAALLFEMNLTDLCNYIFIVKTNLFNVVKRARRRDGYSFFKILKILNSQNVLQLAKKYSYNAEIFYVENNKNYSSLKSQIVKILERNKLK